MGEASDWKTRDAYLLSILEVVGSYFVDVFYNGLYAEARSSRGAAAGLGDEYVRVVSSYAAGLQDPVCYNNMVRGLHQRFTDSTQLGDLGLAGVVDRVAGVLAPEGDFSRLRAEDRDYLLSTLLGGAVAALAAHAISPAGIRLVVTDRAPVAVRKLQDDAMRILLHQRDKIYATFLSAEDKRPPPKLVDEMRTTLRKLAQEKAAALKAAEDERKRADGLAAQLAAAVAAEAKARAAASDLNSRARHYL
ncbi:MAG TPA: hypothetical protein VNI01_10505, partial [Elusimicrobiota bacterium]|nr:hypothetical protein [Elusimicrobiota bacterium]